MWKNSWNNSVLLLNDWKCCGVHYTSIMCIFTHGSNCSIKRTFLFMAMTRECPSLIKDVNNNIKLTPNNDTFFLFTPFDSEPVFTKQKINCQQHHTNSHPTHIISISIPFHTNRIPFPVEKPQISTLPVTRTKIFIKNRGIFSKQNIHRHSSTNFTQNTPTLSHWLSPCIFCAPQNLSTHKNLQLYFLSTQCSFRCCCYDCCFCCCCWDERRS